jgi:hypothetical protein
LSGVLPSGVTGGSGLTALGTVTAGNLSNTAIVYPAGHVIQTISNTSSAYGSTNSQTYQLGHRRGITPIRTNSKILITITSNILVGNTGGSTQVRAYIAIYMTDNSNNLYQSQLRALTTGTSLWQYAGETLSYMHTPTIPSTPVEIVYGIMAKSYNSSAHIYFDDGGPCTVTLQEIAQ